MAARRKFIAGLGALAAGNRLFAAPHHAAVARLKAGGAPPAGNDVAFDASSEGTAETASSPLGWTHTPSGTPAGVLVFVMHNGGATTEINGVTYGGSAMTFVADASDTANEVGHCYAYFLGTSVPTGPQTVSVDYDNTAGVVVYGVAITVTANGNTVVGDFGVDEESQADPLVTLDTGATESLRFAGTYSGASTPAGHTEISGATRVHDSTLTGSTCAVVLRQDAAAVGSVAVGWTVGTDDVAMVGVAIE